MLGSNRVGVDNLLITYFVSVLVVLQVILGKSRLWVVDTTHLSFLTNLNRCSHRVDRRCGVVDVRDITCRWYSSQVLVVQTGLLDIRTQSLPINFSKVEVLKQLLNLIGLWERRIVDVLLESFAGSELRLLKSFIHTVVEGVKVRTV